MCQKTATFVILVFVTLWFSLHLSTSTVSWIFVSVSYRSQLTVLCVMYSYHKNLDSPCRLPLCLVGQFTETVWCCAITCFNVFNKMLSLPCFLTTFPTFGRLKIFQNILNFFWHMNTVKETIGETKT